MENDVIHEMLMLNREMTETIKELSIQINTQHFILTSIFRSLPLDRREFVEKALQSLIASDEFQGRAAEALSLALQQISSSDGSDNPGKSRSFLQLIPGGKKPS